MKNININIKSIYCKDNGLVDHVHLNVMFLVLGKWQSIIKKFKIKKLLKYVKLCYL